MQRAFVALADLVPPLRAHHGQGENIIFTNPLFKGFCRAFCKKLAAGGTRPPTNYPKGAGRYLRYAKVEIR